MRLTDFLLAHHRVYRAFRRITGSDRVNREFVDKYVRPHQGDKILDLGCGPADVCELMPSARYVGVDYSEDYIAAARKRFGGRATFLCGDVNRVADEHIGPFDAILAMGVIHHLNDHEVTRVLRAVRDLLLPGGRFISYDPCFTHPQHPFARWLHRHDRGRFVRFDRHYEQLVSQVFSDFSRNIRTDLCTVPATVIIFECIRPAES